MSANVAELTLIVKARNLAETELAKVRTSLGKITITAKQVATDVAGAFKDVGHRIGRQLGNIATDILSGGDLSRNMVFLGATMAGAAVEGLSAHLIPGIMARIAATSFFAPIVATFTAGGVTAGTVFSAAVAIGMAAMPFIILAAAVAALVYLITNPAARQKAKEVALMIIGRIGDGLRDLGKLLFDNFQRGMGRAGDAFRAGMNKILDIVREKVGNIIDIILWIPRQIAKALDALTHLDDRAKHINVGSGTTGSGPKGGHAEGGWVGLRGPELSWLGEKGPEYVVPNHRLEAMSQGGGGGFRIQGISEREIMKMVDRGLYFKLQRAAPTVLRS